MSRRKSTRLLPGLTAQQITVGNPVIDFMAEKSIEARQALSEIRAMLDTFLRGFLPGGDKPSWKRGVWSDLVPGGALPSWKRGIWT